MNLDSRANGKLARVTRYDAVALIAAWSLLTVAGYAVLSAVAGWMTELHAAGGWIAWNGELVGQAGGPAIGLIGLAGTILILDAMGAIRRFAV